MQICVVSSGSSKGSGISRQNHEIGISEDGAGNGIWERESFNGGIFSLPKKRRRGNQWLVWQEKNDRFMELL